MNESRILCRLTNHEPMDPGHFNMIAQIYCFNYLIYVFHSFSPFDYNISLPIDQNQLRSQLKNDFIFNKWKECSEAAQDCCSNVLSTSVDDDESHCGAVWDGWSCHRTTKAGQISEVKCPHYHVEDNCHTILGQARFKCSENATWFKLEGNEWADYTKCIEPTILLKHRNININIVTNFLSLVFLVSGLLVFFSYRKLQVNRILIHKHFFISLALHSFVQIIWNYFILKDSLESENPIMASNHYLCIIVVAVFKDQSSLKMYYAIGWVVPFLLCSIYAFFSSIYANYGCWVASRSGFEQIIVIPNISILILNVAFLVVIIRLLFKALKTSKTTEINQLRKTFKATIILVPLFGLHFFMSPVILCESSPIAGAYNIFSHLIENLQGVFVSLLLCFFNNEVKQLLKLTVKSRIKTLSIRDLTTISFNRNDISLPTTELNSNATSRHNSIRKNSDLNQSGEHLLQ
ncbi:Calcitonin gene-related peptide type 1 receptor [Brachionus plicatilis]|uniref:Calcitonin gene-related peptide type 1 receptor n=1 Tax=Brachionus plicatilis TaxID=10195 RepID=A0A3M7PLD5_BRAPC|nr:Calcitonin gene-related peptide type 1 receptor [Brachionus plicatilis]